jgi:hypothetical protein
VSVIEGVTLNAFLKNACEAVDRLPNVLERKGVGRPRFDSRSRTIAVLVKAWIDRSYRDTEAYLYDNKEACQFWACGSRPQRHLEDHDASPRIIS